MLLSGVLSLLVVLWALNGRLAPVTGVRVDETGTLSVFGIKGSSVARGACHAGDIVLTLTPEEDKIVERLARDAETAELERARVHCASGNFIGIAASDSFDGASVTFVAPVELWNPAGAVKGKVIAVANATAQQPSRHRRPTSVP